MIGRFMPQHGIYWCWEADEESGDDARKIEALGPREAARAYAENMFSNSAGERHNWRVAVRDRQIGAPWPPQYYRVTAEPEVVFYVQMEVADHEPAT